MAFTIGVGANIRKSPYFDATVADGVRSFSVYNHMYLPAHFGDPAGEYERLVNAVAMWDVGAQRQVELAGPDAGRLAQTLSARDVSGFGVGQGRYVPICNHDGILINDPVMLKLAEDRYWLSIADSDIELWAAAIAAERGYDVAVSEPDVSPLAVQGPLAAPVVASLFGEWINELAYFAFRETALGNIPILLARSGWSKQGGFELYLRDGRRGAELWDIVKTAGAEFGIGPGAPNDIERLESGLLSYGADARLQTHPANPFELGLGKLVNLDCADDFVGKQALARIRDAGIERRLAGFVIDGDPLAENQHPERVMQNEVEVGSIGGLAYSPRLEQNIAIGLIDNVVADDAGDLFVSVGNEMRAARIATLPFIS